MKVSVTIIALACMGLMFANQSVADIDPATIEGLWLFNDGTGKVAKDTSGNKLDGTLENNPKWVNGKYTGTFDSKTGEWKIYIDGKVESELDLTKNQIDADSGPIYIGNDTCCAGRFADAIGDEVIILSVALAEDDVKSLAELGIEGALAVHPTNKLPTTWGSLKRRY